MSKSMVEQFDEMKAEIPVLKEEIEAHKIEAADAVERANVAEQALVEAKELAAKEMAEFKAEAEEIQADLTEKMEDAEVALEGVTKERDDIKALAQLDPSIGDISAGAEAISAGGEEAAEAPEPVDHLAEFNAIQDSEGMNKAESMAYYKEHREAIDAARKS